MAGMHPFNDKTFKHGVIENLFVRLIRSSACTLMRFI
jgi:hypothetical protein